MNVGMTSQYGNNPNSIDPTAKIDDFLKGVVDSLDKQYKNETPDYYKSTIVPQLLAQSRIIVNGQPFGSKQQFQELWGNLPQTQHQVTSFDAHLIPTGPERQYLVLAHIKVKFDESGRNRFGETADLLPRNNNRPLRASFSSPFGVCLTLVVSEKVNQNLNCECISSFDYRITEGPQNSIFTI